MSDWNWNNQVEKRKQPNDNRIIRPQLGQEAEFWFRLARTRYGFLNTGYGIKEQELTCSNSAYSQMKQNLLELECRGENMLRVTKFILKINKEKSIVKTQIQLQSNTISTSTEVGFKTKMTFNTIPPQTLNGSLQSIASDEHLLTKNKYNGISYNKFIVPHKG